jgi:S-formylglutathione hydrolase FrmB
VRRALTSCLVAVVLVGVAAPVANPSTPAPGTVAVQPAGVAGLVTDQQLSDDGRLHELTLDSPALGTSVKTRVLLPASYVDPAAAERRYPVLYLLHGAGGNETDWSRNSQVEEHTAALDLIVVMPDGGRGGFYSDWRNGPAWESFHIGELIPFIDASYRTVAGREGRAVAGLSMGGFGSMTYAARHPDLFLAAASFSGAVDNAAGLHAEAAAFELLHDRYNTPDDNVWGPFETSEANWRAHNPTDLVDNLRSVQLRLTTGNGVPVGTDKVTDSPLEVGVFALNVWLHTGLLLNQVDHEWLPRLHGTHAWSYWDADLAAWLPTLLAVLAQPPPRPQAFEYDSAEPAFAVWGWSFRAERLAQEFLRLDGVWRGGLVATGSGLLHVTTPPLYTPGSIYTVNATGPLSGVVYELAADAGGRLSFTVDLGPSHTAPQFSLEARVAQTTAELTGSYFRTVTVSIAPA